MAINGLVDQGFLNSANLQRIVETPASLLERGRPRIYLDMLESVNATDEELFGRFEAKVYAAEIIADGQTANVYEGVKISTYLDSLANVKIGQGLDQATLNLLDRLVQGKARAVEEDQLFDWETRFGEALMAGVRDQMNHLACRMMIDQFDYDDKGIKLRDGTWGMPTNLKVTPSVPWSSDAGLTANNSAKPTSDILGMDNVDADNYGMGDFDLIVMGTRAFDIMCSTDDFINKAWAALGTAFIPTAASLLKDRKKNLDIAQEVLGKEIILDDKKVRRPSGSGRDVTERTLPANKVLLSRKSNGRREMDWGNGIVTETIVAGVMGAPIIGDNPVFSMGGGYGPIGYYTPATPNLNPPGVAGWAVVRGWPRKHVRECTAVLTIW